jgi:hypothetical protein
LAVAILAVGEWVPLVKGKKAALIQVGASGATVFCMMVVWATYVDFYSDFTIDGGSFIAYIFAWLFYIALLVKTVSVCGCTRVCVCGRHRECMCACACMCKCERMCVCVRVCEIANALIKY